MEAGSLMIFLWYYTCFPVSFITSEFYQFETSYHDHWKEGLLGNDFKDEKIQVLIISQSKRRLGHTGLFFNPHLNLRQLLLSENHDWIHIFFSKYRS